MLLKFRHNYFIMYFSNLLSDNATHSPVSNPACSLLPYFSVSHSFPFTSLILLDTVSSLFTLCHCARSEIISLHGSGALGIQIYVYFSKLASHRPSCLYAGFSISSLCLLSSISLSVSSAMIWSHAWLLQVNLALLFLGSYSPLHIYSILQSNYYCAGLAYFYTCLPRIPKLFDSWDFVLLSKYL